MLKMSRNNRGSVFLIGQIALALMFTAATVETARSGVLARNMKVIGCKMANKGEEFCNAKYNYTPKVQKPAGIMNGGSFDSGYMR